MNLTLMVQYTTYIFLLASYKSHLLSANKSFKAKWLLHARLSLILNIIHFFHFYLLAPFGSYGNEGLLPLAIYLFR